MDLGTAVVSRTPSSRKVNDCHEIVKSSGVAGERRGNLCSVHQSGVRFVFYFTSCFRNNIKKRNFIKMHFF